LASFLILNSLNLIVSKELIPSQEKGKSLDLAERVIAADEDAAKKIFQDAVYLLCRPVLWHDTVGALSASFSVDGKQQEQGIELGDHIRIKIPGPGFIEGDGEDWVRVGVVEKNLDEQFDESFGVLLIVCPNPHTTGDAIAHFFGEGASSSFLLTRKDNTVTAHYKGRNESPNTEELALTDKIRNFVVARAALAGISELQWRALLKGLLASDDD
jgi:hypothetical protein